VSENGSPGRPVPRQGTFLLGLSLVTGAMLALEVLDTRLLSVITWYSLAFLVIAMGLFGLTAGAVRVYLTPERYAPDRLSSELSRECRRLAAAIPVSLILLLLIPLRAEAVATTVALFVVFSTAIALPFYPAGIVIAAALTRSPFPIGRVYAVDLLGAALGAPLVPLLLSIVDGSTAILLLAVLAALASVLFALACGDKNQVARGLLAALLLAVICGLNANNGRGLVPLWVKGLPELRERVELELWNSHSRVQVNKVGRMPAVLWGKGTRCEAPFVQQREIVIDGHAATPIYLEPLSSLKFLSCDVINLVHDLRPHGPAAVIGVGGSRDIQAALLTGHSPVVGIELNGRLLQILRGPYGRQTGVIGRSDVELVHDEARSYLSRTDRRFSVIQASLIDTWAATGAGAHALGENGLYTIDAWRLFLDRLEPGGLFTVSRWSTVETARLVALGAGAVLERGGGRPRDHIVLASSGTISTLIVARDPLGRDDLRRIKQVAKERGFQIVAGPETHSTADRLERVLEATSRAELDRIALLPALDFRPPTDDKPFFFNVIRLRALFKPLPEVTQGSIEGNLLATRTLGFALFASVLLVGIGIGLPLARRARPAGRSNRSLWAALAYFAAIGIGFMLAEIALLQRLTLVLGHPSYSLMVVLASLVGAAGVGSLLSDRLPLTRAPYCYVFPLALVLLLAALALSWHSIAPRFMAAPTATRIGFALTITALTGLPLGLAFPTGLRLCRSLHEDELPWLWGINGAGSVLASSLAISIALECGLTTLTLAAAGCYAVLLPAIVVLRRRENRERDRASTASVASEVAGPSVG
jgi:hypothetical protein